MLKKGFLINATFLPNEPSRAVCYLATLYTTLCNLNGECRGRSGSGLTISQVQPYYIPFSKPYIHKWTVDLHDFVRRMYVMHSFFFFWYHMFLGWQPRWFILDSGVLSYYLAPTEVHLGSRGSLKVASCDIIGTYMRMYIERPSDDFMDESL